MKKTAALSVACLLLLFGAIGYRCSGMSRLQVPPQQESEAISKLVLRDAQLFASAISQPVKSRAGRPESSRFIDLFTVGTGCLSTYTTDYISAPEGYVFGSVGPDGERGTSDDIVYIIKGEGGLHPTSAESLPQNNSKSKACLHL